MGSWRQKIANYFCLSCIGIFLLTLALTGLFVAVVLGRTAGEGAAQMPALIVFLYRILRPLSDLPALSLWTIFLPAVGGAVATLVGRRRETLRDLMIVLTTFSTFVLILAMYPRVINGGLSATVPGILGYGLHFRVDLLSYVILSTAVFLWLMVSIFAHEYIKAVNHRNRFYLFMSFTLTGVLGTAMAADALTMYLFFEVMTFSSYLLVAHKQSAESVLAGNNYIYMGVVGGLSLLLAMMLLLFYTGTLEFAPLAAQMSVLGWRRHLIAGLFIAGFGVKAGMLPLHIWLPKAHPVAPTPASALLSGLLIKMGAYGMLRIVTSLFMPVIENSEAPLEVLWILSRQVGAPLIWIGLMTMVAGVFMALQQGHLKKMLAYHSISQMGYIVMGIGVAAYLGPLGPMGFAGSLFHTVNHAFFKGLLFMVAGAVYMKTGELDMYKLGGLWSRMPFTALACLIAALGITGTPGFNGYASKTLLHHAIVEAYAYGHDVFRYAEAVFIVVSAGTVCSFIKLLYYVFLRPCSGSPLKVAGEGNGMIQLAMAGLAALIVSLGVAPGFLMERFIVPAINGFAYDPAFVQKYLSGISFFNQTDLQAMIPVYLLGVVMFLAGKKLDLFHITLPRWLDVEGVLYKPVYQGFINLSQQVVRICERPASQGDVALYVLCLIAALFFLIF